MAEMDSSRPILRITYSMALHLPSHTTLGSVPARGLVAEPLEHSQIKPLEVPQFRKTIVPGEVPAVNGEPVTAANAPVKGSMLSA